MDVPPVGAIGSGRGARPTEISRDDDYDREVRIARRFRDSEADRRRRQQQAPPPRKPAQDEIGEESGSDEPRAGAELDTYL